LWHGNAEAARKNSQHIICGRNDVTEFFLTPKCIGDIIYMGFKTFVYGSKRNMK